ncbi:glycosyltransferase family 4 protein [Photobacterium leiognathi]|uniref:glycosyltransferase family 4 protein n=1 Tax=Photobacterium leiognathi TaxID=553611 RepID=UPI00273A465A|nr:glycosyltransferase family 4 protein [Photobacterium leiognathi]
MFIIQFHKYEKIFLHCLLSEVYFLFHRLLFLSRYKKAVVTIHNIIYKTAFLDYNLVKANIISFIWPLLWRLPRKVVFISKSQKEQYESDGYVYKNSCVIYNGINFDKLNKLIALNNIYHNNVLEFKSGYTLLGIACTLNKVKNVDIIINALSELDDNYRLLIIGSGPEENRLKELTLELGLDSRILFIPYHYNHFSLLSIVDIYLQPSISEGFGLSAIEAATVCKKILLSNIPTFTDIFSDIDVQFFLVENKNSLIENINRLNARQVDYHNNRNKIIKKFNLKRCMENYDKV